MACGRGQIVMRFDASAVEAQVWAQQHAARLVQQISAEARATIRAVVVEGFETGIGPRATARLIHDTIGLTERHAGAVVKHRAKLIARGSSEAAADKAAAKYAAKLRRSRALAIARTETMTAANEGQVQLWKQAQEAGHLTGKEKKVWITADPCPICAPMEGKTVKLNEEFSISGPPAHPNCRCTVGLLQ